ncbi:MAG: hypothetical protein J6J83_00830 [Oscillospiraceae bacterium]|nr:hypothetical protein [Oscillospiraceae bacterium]
MTRKKFIKRAMAAGTSRNCAAAQARLLSYYGSYERLHYALYGQFWQSPQWWAAMQALHRAADKAAYMIAECFRQVLHG